VRAPDAANALKLTAKHLVKFGMVDDIIPEPQGGAHWDPNAVAEALKAKMKVTEKAVSTFMKLLGLE
jgi:acetyl-CoA carboxylase carboxyl transferase subunit alpha